MVTTLSSQIARATERAYLPLIGAKRMTAVLNAAELILANERGDWNAQEIRRPDGQLYMVRHFVSARFESPQVWVHEILLPDTDRDPHDHPWDYKTTLIRGAYNEEVDGSTSDYAEGDVLSRKAENLHRLHLTSPVVTLFAAGKKRRSWGFATEAGWVEASAYLTQQDPALQGRTQW